VWGWISHHKAIAVVIGLILSILAPFTLVIVGLVAFFKNWSTIWGGIKTAAVAVWNALVTAWNATYNAVVGTGKAILDWFQRLPGRVWDFIKGLVDKLTTFGGNLIHSIWNGITGAWDWLTTNLKKIPGWFLNALGDGAKWLLDFGKSIVSGLWDGIKSLGSWIWDKVKSIIPGWIKGALGIKSPPQWAIDIGKYILEGIANGVTKLPHLLADLAADATKALGKFGFGQSSNAYAGGSLGSSHAAIIATALQLAGAAVTQANEAAVDVIVTNESGWNPRAINLTDSNAAAGDPSRGLMQTIGSTFEAYRSIGLPDDIYNPLANLVAGIRYAISRYGSLQAVPGVYSTAQGHPYVGYETGAWNIARDQLAYLHRGEMVVPREPAEKIRSGSGGPTVVRLDPWSVAAIASAVSVELDGDVVAKAVTARQDYVSSRGIRR
jgi:hypothetical protein